MTALILNHRVHCFDVTIKSLHPDHPLVQTHTPTRTLLFMLQADCMGLRKNTRVHCKSRGISIHTYWHLGVNFRKPTRKTHKLCLSFWVYVAISIKCTYTCVNVRKKKRPFIYDCIDVCMHICVCVYLHDAPTSPLCNSATVTLHHRPYALNNTWVDIITAARSRHAAVALQQAMRWNRGCPSFQAASS